jgi:hypothetical protein
VTGVRPTSVRRGRDVVAITHRDLACPATVQFGTVAPTSRVATRIPCGHGRSRKPFYREVPLNAVERRLLEEWLEARRSIATEGVPALADWRAADQALDRSHGPARRTSCRAVRSRRMGCATRSGPGWCVPVMIWRWSSSLRSTVGWTPRAATACLQPLTGAAVANLEVEF